MKKIIAVLAIGLSFTAANAQQVKEKQVPPAVKSSFTKMFTGIKQVKWDKEKNQYEATYTNGQHKNSVLFDNTGKWTEKETAIAVQELPQQALAYMKEHFKGHDLKGAAKITKVNGEVQYEAEISGKDVFFNQQGAFIKAEKV